MSNARLRKKGNVNTDHTGHCQQWTVCAWFLLGFIQVFEGGALLLAQNVIIENSDTLGSEFPPASTPVVLKMCSSDQQP